MCRPFYHHPTRLFSDTYKSIIGITPIPDTNMTASWVHMISYDAQYYGYLVRPD